jgi:hypothetical protein
MAIGQAGIGIGIGMGMGIGIGMFRSSAAAGYDPCLTNFCTRAVSRYVAERGEIAPDRTGHAQIKTAYYLRPVEHYQSRALAMM